MADTVSIIKVKSDSGVDTSGLFGGGRGGGKAFDGLLTLGLLAGSAIAGYFVVSKLSESGALDSLGSSINSQLEGVFSDINTAIEEGASSGSGGSSSSDVSGSSDSNADEEDDTHSLKRVNATYAYPFNIVQYNLDDGGYHDCGSSIDPLFGPKSSYRYQSPSDYIVDF